MMSPVQLIVLLNIHWTGESGRSAVTTQSMDDAVIFLETNEYISIEKQGDPFKLTEKGECYVKALCSLPTPVEVTKWEIPNESKSAS